MAVGDITRNAYSLHADGNQWVMTGTIEVSDAVTAYAIVSSPAYINSLMLVCEDGTGVAQVECNVNASDVATNGTCKIHGNDPTVRTYRYRCSFLGM